MATNYSVVSWNRQKRRYDTVLAGLVMVYLLIFAGLQLLLFPDITAETTIIRATSTLAFLLLHLVLVIGPLCRLDARFLPLLYNRRHLGVTMFCLAAVHGVFSLIQFHALGNVNPLVSLFSSERAYGQFSQFPFQPLGFFALLILFIMAATSHDFWLKNLTPRIWKSLHISVYVAYGLIVIHVALGILQQETAPAYAVIMGTGLLTVLSLHLLSAFRGNRHELHPTDPGTDGFVFVSAAADIPDNRAKTLLIGDENIAVFRYGDKLSAVSNVCRHQLGPLGEGKIIDGCIVCPWHGYQYKPHDGQSPPPFHEKLETYTVRYQDGNVWVNPKPHPPGTALTPALIA